MTTRVDTSGPSSAKARSAIVIAGKARGMTLDDIRALTPKGSVSMLSAREAAELLGRLNAGTAYDRPAPPRKRRPRGTMPIQPSPAVVCLDATLQIELAAAYRWSPEELDAWLDARHFGDGRSMLRAKTHHDYLERIELLKGVVKRAMAAMRAAVGLTKEEESCPF